MMKKLTYKIKFSGIARGEALLPDIKLAPQERIVSMSVMPYAAVYLIERTVNTRCRISTKRGRHQ